MKSKYKTKDRRRSVWKLNAIEMNPEGRYGILLAGTVPAFSILNGA